MPNQIEHVFVLMLENRSFDHMLGFSGIAGTDPSTGEATRLRGLEAIGFDLRSVMRAFGAGTLVELAKAEGLEWPPPAPLSIRQLLTSNVYEGQSYSVQQPARYAMPADPGHEFCDVLQQLCGVASVARNPDGSGCNPVAYTPGGAYPPILGTGFVASWMAACTRRAGAVCDPGEIMKCYSPAQLPVLTTLAQEFTVCDNWFASLPGPTWPNRFFVHAASSGGLDHSPSIAEMVKWETLDGFSFRNGTIFQRLEDQSLSWRLYAGDSLPIAAALKGINLTDVRHYADFANDLQSGYSAAYTFIEPQYNSLSDFVCGTSQHPLDDVTRGEALIKCTYEAIRNSSVWSSSVLILVWDEHGGFYDHVSPPAAVAPGDTLPGDSHNQYGFTFEQYGPRVPALAISPLIPRNLIDHRVYDHASVPASLEKWFGLSPLTQRDAQANDLSSLVSLAAPRTDTPAVLPSPAASGVTGCGPVPCLSAAAPAALSVLPTVPLARPLDPIDEGNLPGFLQIGLRWHLSAASPSERPAILQRWSNLRTRADAYTYLSDVDAAVRNSPSGGIGA